MKTLQRSAPGRLAPVSATQAPAAPTPPLHAGAMHSFSQLAVHPASPPVVQRAPIRKKKTAYRTAPYRKSSKFRFIRWQRRSLAGHTTKAKAGINFFTVKYKKGSKAYYLTTRSVPSTNQASFKLAPGHSEERHQLISTKFEKRHKLKPSHRQWAATEREPCGQGPGMANCRQTLHTIGIPANQTFFASEYADREDMRSKPAQKPAELNALASAHRHAHNQTHENNVMWLGSHHDSDSESEDEKNVVDEYESDYGENPQPRRKRANPALKKAFRKGFKK